MRRSAKHTSRSAKRVSWSAKQAARSAERASQSLNPSRWNASIFTRTFDLEPVEYNHVRKLMKKVLQKDRMYGDYMNTEMAKNYLDDMVEYFPVPPCLEGKTSEDELKNQLKYLARRVSLNGRRSSINDSSDSGSGPEEDPLGGVQHLSAEPGAHKPKARHADAEPVNRELVAKPIDAKPATRQLRAQDPGARLASYVLTVKGPETHDWSTCLATDMLKCKKNPVDLTLDDLDYKKWVGYLEEDISFDPATQFLVWKKSDNAVPVYVKNERSLRVAVHCNLLDNPSQQEIVFSVIEGKDFLFLFFLNHISSHPARR